jgi:predicted nucleic acid-binding protein
VSSCFFDTSALGKNYHVEVGTEEVERLLVLPDARNFISRLSIVEMQSVFARKVRSNVIVDADFELLRRRFLTDVTQRLLRVVRMTGLHYQEAERLIREHALERSLRTLDALQLAVALDVRRRTGLDHFVCADRNLCAVARVVGLSVINPEELLQQGE